MWPRSKCCRNNILAAHPAADAIATLGGETMGTTWSVRLVAAPSADLHALHAGIQTQLTRVVRQMSTWEADSQISAYNRAACGTWHAVAPEFQRVLGCALEIARASNGAFDPTVGPLVGLWGFGADAHCDAPTQAAVQRERRRVDWRRIALDRDAGQLLQPGDVRIDLSAIAKGFGVDQVVEWLQAAGVTAALVEVGGELRGYGRKPDDAAWHVLVEAGPDEADDVSEPRVLLLDDIAVASSGDRWHHYQRDGRRYTHTIDPRTGEPHEHAAAAVTVIAHEAMRADAWATALTVLGGAQGFALAQQRGLAARFLERTETGLRERMTDAFHAHLVA